MNFLFHMILSGDDDQLLVGNFMGDFVKGLLQERFSPPVRKGVLLHRKIDSFAERNDHFRQSRQRLPKEYGLYRGVLVDLFYDYYLVNDWSSWCKEPLGGYLSRTRAILESNRQSLPVEMHRLLPVIFDELLLSYGTVEGIGNALSRLSRRIKRSNPVVGAEVELVRQHDELLSDFRAFTPEIFRFVDDMMHAEDTLIV